jgi:aspartate aminotransferase
MDDNHTHYYGPVYGWPSFVDASSKSFSNGAPCLLMFATGQIALGPELGTSPRIASIQTLSGTGACHMAALWLVEHYDFPTETKDIYISNPSWFNVSLRAALFARLTFKCSTIM